MKIKMSAYELACEEEAGFCISCDDFTAWGVEPDAEGYDCPNCEQPTVQGAENAMIEGNIIVK